MTSNTWVERLTPLLGGTAAAVLVVALVVQPVFGQAATVNTCSLCIGYHEYIGAKDSSKSGCVKGPGQYGYYAWRSCVEQYKIRMCQGEGKACPGKDIPDTLKDCGSSGCGFLEEEDDALCSWDCWGRPCQNYVINGDACRDVPQKCGPPEASTECFKCMCTNIR